MFQQISRCRMLQQKMNIMNLVPYYNQDSYIVFPLLPVAVPRGAKLFFHALNTHKNKFEENYSYTVELREFLVLHYADIMLAIRTVKREGRFVRITRRRIGR